MRRFAFTLIELLVVVAIIAILAALLFPVFARAKESAKKTTCVSNIGQIGKAILLYTSENDDVYPRGDDCIQGGSLNPALNRPGAVSGNGCSGPFPYRINHYKWPAWLIPYAPSTQVFMCPSREIDPTAWGTNGEIMNGYALNLAFTGALNTWNPNTTSGRYRNSFTGGTQSGIPEPSSAMLLMELSASEISFMPVFLTPARTAVQTAYPAALRELWAPYMLKWVASNNCATTSDIDGRRLPHSGGFVIGRADGGAKFYSAKSFLAQCPTRAEYVVGTYSGGWQCGPVDGSRDIGAAPTWSAEWPLWGLSL